MNFETFEPTLNENLSAGVIIELWQNRKDWRAYMEGPNPQAMELIEKFLREDALSHNLFKQPSPARPPVATFSWQSPNGVWHQGALYLNGAVYRQALNDYVCHTLLIDDATAIGASYPSDGWVRLHELEVQDPE